MDLILSSGFLAFARHVGFLQAVEERGIAVSGTGAREVLCPAWAQAGFTL